MWVRATIERAALEAEVGRSHGSLRWDKGRKIKRGRCRCLHIHASDPLSPLQSGPLELTLRYQKMLLCSSTSLGFPFHCVEIENEVARVMSGFLCGPANTYASRADDRREVEQKLLVLTWSSKKWVFRGS